jgi:conjugative transfer signal peptidase TraF
MVEDLGGLRGRAVARLQARRGWIKVGLLVVATLGVAALALPVAAGSAQLVWNATASAPAGLYRIAHERWHVGDRVAVLPADTLAEELDRRGVLPRGKLLIKRVVAVSGDSVCRRDGTVLVNDEVIAQAKSKDSTGEPLPSWQGCSSLNEGQVFLLGDAAGSYDGRYFGVTRASEIIGRADLLLTF